MLVLSRKAGERVILDGRIEVVVLKTQGNNVRLGFVAPPEVTIHRQEVFESVKKERAAGVGVAVQ